MSSSATATALPRSGATRQTARFLEDVHALQDSSRPQTDLPSLTQRKFGEVEQQRPNRAEIAPVLRRGEGEVDRPDLVRRIRLGPWGCCDSSQQGERRDCSSHRSIFRMSSTPDATAARGCGHMPMRYDFDAPARRSHLLCSATTGCQSAGGGFARRSRQRAIMIRRRRIGAAERDRLLEERDRLVSSAVSSYAASPAS